MPEKKVDFEKKVNDAKKATVETAEKVGAESKKVAGKIGKRWNKASTTDKVLRILGVILLIIGLVVLWEFIGGLILILLGIAFVSGFFVNKE